MQEEPFSLTSSYAVFASTDRYFFHAEPYCESDINLDPLVWRLGQGCAVALGLIEKCDLQNLCHVTFANLFTSLPQLDVLSDAGLVDLVPSNKTDCKCSRC